MSENETFQSWAIVEIMGHRKLAGYVTSPGGPGALAGMLRIDIPEDYEADVITDSMVTQFYGQSAVFSITATNEDGARAWHRSEPWGARIMPLIPPAPSDGYDHFEDYATEDGEAEQDQAI